MLKPFILWQIRKQNFKNSPLGNVSFDGSGQDKENVWWVYDEYRVSGDRWGQHCWESDRGNARIPGKWIYKQLIKWQDDIMRCIRIPNLWNLSCVAI